MDPVRVLPLELLDYIWSMLSLPDILSCMAVCRIWRETISECIEIWRPLCHTTILHCNSWYLTYLEETKMRWSWKVGSFNEGTIIEGCQHFCCSDDFIYIVDFNDSLCKYNSMGKLIKEIASPNGCIQIFALNKDVALLCARSEFSEIIVYNEELYEVARFTTINEEVYTSGGRIWARSASDNRLVTAYYAEGTENQERHMEQLSISPGSRLMPLYNGWCSMYQGEVYEMYGDHKLRIYKCDPTPMSRIFMNMFSNNNDIIVIIDKKIIAGKHTFCTVLIYRNSSRLYRADIPKQLRLWCFSGQYLVLASSKDISTIDLSTGALHIGEENKSLNFSDFIYSIKNLFEDPKLAWVVVDHGNNFVVRDIEKDIDLIVVDCGRTASMIASCVCSLVCVKNMFVYTLKGNRLMVKKTAID